MCACVGGVGVGVGVGVGGGGVCVCVEVGLLLQASPLYNGNVAALFYSFTFRV